LYYAWGPEKLINRALMSETRPMTHTPFLLSLPPEAAGNYLSCYTRWQNETGWLGRPGAIQHTLIAWRGEGSGSDEGREKRTP
jgi:hypothetical protein